MNKNLRSRIAALKEKLDIEIDSIRFKDGKVITGDIAAALDSLIAGKPTVMAKEVLTELKRGNPDTIGLAYIFQAYDAGAVAEIWANYKV